MLKGAWEFTHAFFLALFNECGHFIDDFFHSGFGLGTWSSEKG